MSTMKCQVKRTFNHRLIAATSSLPLNTDLPFIMMVNELTKVKVGGITHGP